MVNSEKTATKEPSQFPKLMVGPKGLVVFFEKWECGLVVFPSEGYRIGRISLAWDMSNFSDYDGQITLTNS